MTVEGQRRLSLNPRCSQPSPIGLTRRFRLQPRQQAPVAPARWCHLFSETPPQKKAEAVATEPAVEKVTEPRLLSSRGKARGTVRRAACSRAQPTAEELEQERIRRARAQYITPQHAHHRPPGAPGTRRSIARRRKRDHSRL